MQAIKIHKSVIKVSRKLSKQNNLRKVGIIVPTKSDNDVILCLQLVSKTLTCTLHLS